MKKFLLPFWVVLLLSCSAWSQDGDIERRHFQLGAINYFGYGGLPLDKVRAAIPLHTGDTLTIASFPRKLVDDAVADATGKSPTDVGLVCCDDSNRLLIFIGLQGSTSRPVPIRASPSGTAHLDGIGLHLYEQEMSALARAVASGTTGEDDSQGYMLSSDPDVKAVNLAMRDYAVERESEIANVLETARDASQRRAAAALLGYVRRSQTQADALAKAMYDPDQEVRNNAVRALSVLYAAPASSQLQINVQALVNLLYSGVWTDRNKASLLLLHVTSTRNPTVLNVLRKEAIGPLIEGASWTGDAGHSLPFLIILGRLGNIPDDKLNQMIKSNNPDAVISAALPSANKP